VFNNSGQRSQQHIRHRLLQRPVQELVDTPLVPGFNGLVIGDVARDIGVVGNGPARPRGNTILIPKRAKAILNINVRVHLLAHHLY
jgi:hypothetical protein